MESLEAFLRALKMYVIIGLLAGAINGLVFNPPTGATRLERATTVMSDVVWWPRLLVMATRAADARLGAMPREAQPLLYAWLRGRSGEPHVGR